MRFVTFRDLRMKGREVLDRLAESREMVLTSKGRPVALISAVSEEDFEASLSAIRQARAAVAVAGMRAVSAARGTHRMSPREIEREIRAARKAPSR